MFPSHSYSDQALPFESNTTTTLSKQEIANYDLIPSPSPPPLSFFHFPYSPPPFEDNQIFLEQPHDFLFPQFQHQQPDLASEPEPPQQPEPVVDNMITEVISTNKSVVIPSARKRPIGKRERHSKINTAKGLRDRRMRLSLEVAKRFFGLQDMLGFDKASKTVEWLLNQAKVEINKLLAAAKKSSTSVAAVSSTSELSSLEDQVVVVVNNDLAETGERNIPKGVKKKKRRTIKQFHPLATRECRAKARERARERTKEKMMRSKQCCTKETTTTNVVHNKLSQIQLGGSWNPLFGEESGTVQSQLISLNNHHSLDLVTNKAKELSCSLPKEQYLGTSTTSTTVESLAAIMGKSSSTSSMVFSSLNNYNSGLHQEASLN